LSQEGLQQFYALGGGQLGAVGQAPRAPELDWLSEHEQRFLQADGSVCMTLDVQGIRCAACVWLLQELWKRQPGGKALRVDASMGRATLVYEQKKGTGAHFLDRAARLGYPMAPATRKVQRDTSLLLRLGICAALAMNAMILAVAQYAGLAEVDASTDRVFHWVSRARAAGIGVPEIEFGTLFAYQQRLLVHSERVVKADGHGCGSLPVGFTVFRPRTDQSNGHATMMQAFV
jgi:Cu2+-exporting ATPase